MFARLVRFKLEPGTEMQAQQLADDLTPLIAGQPGCQAVTIFGDDADGEYGIYVLWDSQEHADAAAGIVRPQLDKHLAGKIARPPEPKLFRVLGSG